MPIGARERVVGRGGRVSTGDFSFFPTRELLLDRVKSPLSPFAAFPPSCPSDGRQSGDFTCPLDDGALSPSDAAQVVPERSDGRWWENSDSNGKEGSSGDNF